VAVGVVVVAQKKRRKKEDQGLKNEDLRSGLNFQIQIKKHAHQRERVVSSSNSTRVWLGRLPLMVEARLYRLNILLFGPFFLKKIHV
jgi:hypothetical protein